MFTFVKNTNRNQKHKNKIVHSQRNESISDSLKWKTNYNNKGTCIHASRPEKTKCETLIKKPKKKEPTAVYEVHLKIKHPTLSQIKRQTENNNKNQSKQKKLVQEPKNKDNCCKRECRMTFDTNPDSHQYKVTLDCGHSFHAVCASQILINRDRQPSLPLRCKLCLGMVF